jgi:outer membrane protein assembly factor BamE (lipoprotein component of BamABCDE complex)
MRLKNVNRALFVCFVTSFALFGCQSAEEHARDVEAANADANRLTVGTVQREVRVGMSGAEVAAVLGSPNIVTSDERRRETWIYDRISTNKAYSKSSGGVSALVLAGVLVGDTLGGGLGGGNYSSSDGASSTTQKSLTVIIKFDEEGLVRDFAYHSSTF